MDELLALSAAQQGLLTRAQVGAAALLPGQFAHEDWEARGSYVLAWRGAPDTPARLLMAAVLDAGSGAVVSGPTAAAWWGLPGFDVRQVHVSRVRRPGLQRATLAGYVHDVTSLPPSHVTVHQGIPVVRPERMTVELFGMLTPGRAGRTAENAWSRRLLDGPGLRRVASELGLARRGAAALREFLEERPDDWVPPQSGLEARFEWVVRRYSLGTWRRQVDVGGEAGWTGRVDFLCHDVPVVVEVQSELFHAALADRDADADRHERLRRDGFVVVEAWEHELWHDPDTVADDVLRAFADARFPRFDRELVAASRD